MFSNADIASMTGMVRSASSISSCLPLMGFTQSNDLGFTNLTIVAINNSDDNYLYAVSNIPINAKSGALVYNSPGTTANADLTGTGTLYPGPSAALAADVSGFVLKFALGAHVSIGSSPSSCYIQGYFVGNKQIYLDNKQQNVFMRLRINNIPVGRITQTQNQPPGSLTDQSQFFASWPLDATFGNLITKYANQHDSGYYLFPPQSPSNISNKIYQVSVDLVDDFGNALDGNNVDWACLIKLT